MSDNQINDGEKNASGTKKNFGLDLFWTSITLTFGVGLVLAVLLSPGALDNRKTSKGAQVYSDLRALGIAIESYFNDNQSYPAWATGPQGANATQPPDSPAYRVPTFRIRTGPNDPVATMTTPISYITSFFRDPFVPYKNATYAYFSLSEDAAQGVGWILWSPGPDGVYQLDPAEEYRPLERMPSITMLQKSYDSTNGTTSAGDIWRIKQ